MHAVFGLGPLSQDSKLSSAPVNLHLHAQLLWLPSGAQKLIGFSTLWSFLLLMGSNEQALMAAHIRRLAN